MNHRHKQMAKEATTVHPSRSTVIVLLLLFSLLLTPYVEASVVQQNRPASNKDMSSNSIAISARSTGLSKCARSGPRLAEYRP